MAEDPAALLQRIAELEEEVKTLREACQCGARLQHGRSAVSPGRSGSSLKPVAPVVLPRPPMPKSAPPPPASLLPPPQNLPPPPSLVTNLPPLPRERVLSTAPVGSRKSTGPESEKPLLPAFPVPPDRNLSKSGRTERSPSIADGNVSPRPASLSMDGHNPVGAAITRSPRSSSLDVSLPPASMSSSSSPRNEDYFSVSLRGLVDESSVQDAVGGQGKLVLSVASMVNEGKSFLVKAVLTGQAGKWMWSVPRVYSSFQTLSKAIGSSVASNDLPKLKPTLADQERVMVLNAYLMDTNNQLGSHLSMAMMRFADPFEGPSSYGLRSLTPIHEGPLELTAAKGSKPQQFYFMLKENLFYFRSNNEESPVGVISLEYVTLEIVVDAGFPRFTFSISTLQKEPLAYLSAESTKSMSEWILKIRRAKFLRTGMTYGVASGSTAEEVSVCPKVVVAKDMFSAYLNNHSVPLLTEPLVQNPLEWVECADTPENIVYQEGSIREGTVQKLTERAFDEQLSSTHFVCVYMATCRYWIKPIDLFSYFVSAWEKAPSDQEVTLRQVRLLLVLRLWLSHHFADFYENHNLAKHVLHFIHSKLSAPMFQKYHAVLLEAIRDHVVSSTSTGGANPLLPAVFSKEHIEIIDFHPLEIARQMTLYSFGLFCAIEPSEIMQQRWNSAEKERQKLCPNVMRMIRRFNTVSLWVQTVVLSVNSIDVRVAILSRLLEVCVHLLELNNFSSVWELCSGLQGSAVRRLTDTWDKLSEESQATWKRLLEFCDSSANFKQYRTRLAESSGASIPHVGRYLSDLTFAEDASKTFVDKRVNFGKSLVIGSVLMDIQKRQRCKYAIKSVDSFQSYFQRLNPLTEEALYVRSLKCQEKK